MSGLNEIVVVGGSLAGLRGAEALRQGGFEGRLHFVGAESHLPYDRPPLSKEVLRGDWEPERASLAVPDRFDGLDLQLHLGRRATTLDAAARCVRLDDGTSLPFDGMLIATGARARTLPGALDLDGLSTLRTLDDCLRLRERLDASPRVAVVGAGFIGAEVAATCRSRGLDVTLIEALDVPLGRVLGSDVGLAIAEHHRDHGVDVRLGVGVEAIEGSSRVEAVRLQDGKRVAADIVVVGIGVAPETEWLDGSGMALENGIVCDATCATSIPGVVAAGDVASWENPAFGERMRIEHWSNASDMARAAAATLLAGDAAPPYSSVPFFWSDQYDLKVQSAGMLAGADETRVVKGTLAERKFLKLYGRNGRLAGALAFNEPRSLIRCRSLIRDASSLEDAASVFAT